MVNYTYILNFENEYPHQDKINWTDANWALSFYAVAIYLCLVAYGKHQMKSRPRMECRRQLVAWNASLAVFSIVTLLRIMPDLVQIVGEHGFHHSVCNPRTLYASRLSLWTWLFGVSKFIELGDTLFVVLRKQPLMFLHWYHHVTVFVYTCYTSIHVTAVHWFASLNLLAHSLMYSYYALKALGVKVPRVVSMFITIVQLMQMVVGVFINLYTYDVLSRGQVCYTTYENIRVSLLMYFSYFLLFLHYFRKAYLSKRTLRSVMKED